MGHLFRTSVMLIATRSCTWRPAERMLGMKCYTINCRQTSSKSKKRANAKAKEEVLEGTQKWVDWQLVRFTPEDLEKYKFDMPLGLTHLPALVEKIGVVPELLVGFTSAFDA